MNATLVTAPPGPIRWKHSIAWLVLLAPLFFLSYGWANQLAASRGVNASIVFGWESAIPFWPWTIVPYWSIDLMYGLSFLACRTPREVNHHGLRLLTAQLISVACFVAFPLRFSADKPAADGVFGALFDALAGFDLPYNQAPSLHIGLLLIIWWVLVRRASPGQRLFWHAWAALVAASVLTTWQHHFFDLPTGALVGLLCLWLWPDRGESPLRSRADATRPRLALRYGLAALACGLVALLGGVALLAIWPAVALALVAVNYAWLGTHGFQKHDGRQSAAVRWLLAPYRLGAWINSRLWTRRHPAPDAITDTVWLGRLSTPAEMAAHGFDAIVDLTAEFDTPLGARLSYNVPMLDLAVPPLAALQQAVRALTQAEASAGRVLVCCALGYSRSALTVAAWLLASGREVHLEGAIARVRAARPQVVFTDAHRALLETFADAR
ncbi:phosphatase PAP2/dual specificity phosphatase family protein [Denitromonas iodatirespirans]|uniref:Phosphatase PAP2/dual specificity phosphatase family protein n=1 Tax=Denitromonas iodatirespirans TaxID=2795389 RepID=A0A944H9W2_DENI1|nr:phosphatase PAP2/dual specificity phosphatase family protein [Denitromonas iodatirespirans]MBT0963878.1 phosphatase PAP2/dual specificity phosphatase family protein [Denitromonas iodatirespirans]